MGAGKSRLGAELMQLSLDELMQLQLAELRQLQLADLMQMQVAELTQLQLVAAGSQAHPTLDRDGAIGGEAHRTLGRRSIDTTDTSHECDEVLY